MLSIIVLETGTRNIKVYSCICSRRSHTISGHASEALAKHMLEKNRASIGATNTNPAADFLMPKNPPFQNSTIIAPQVTQVGIYFYPINSYI